MHYGQITGDEYFFIAQIHVPKMCTKKDLADFLISKENELNHRSDELRYSVSWCLRSAMQQQGLVTDCFMTGFLNEALCKFF